MHPVDECMTHAIVCNGYDSTYNADMCNNVWLSFQDAGDAQSSTNWRLIMTYFNMIKIIESTGIGLVYGLRFYGKGQLDVEDMVVYIEVLSCESLY